MPRPRLRQRFGSSRKARPSRASTAQRSSQGVQAGQRSADGVACQPRGRRFLPSPRMGKKARPQKARYSITGSTYLSVTSVSPIRVTSKPRPLIPKRTPPPSKLRRTSSSTRPLLSMVSRQRRRRSHRVSPRGTAGSKGPWGSIPESSARTRSVSEAASEKSCPERARAAAARYRSRGTRRSRCGRAMAKPSSRSSGGSAPATARATSSTEGTSSTATGTPSSVQRSRAPSISTVTPSAASQAFSQLARSPGERSSAISDHLHRLAHDVIGLAQHRLQEGQPPDAVALAEDPEAPGLLPVGLGEVAPHHQAHPVQVGRDRARSSVGGEPDPGPAVAVVGGDQVQDQLRVAPLQVTPLQIAGQQADAQQLVAAASRPAGGTAVRLDPLGRCARLGQGGGGHRLWVEPALEAEVVLAQVVETAGPLQRPDHGLRQAQPLGHAARLLAHRPQVVGEESRAALEPQLLQGVGPQPQALPDPLPPPRLQVERQAAVVTDEAPVAEPGQIPVPLRLVEPGMGFDRGQDLQQPSDELSLLLRFQLFRPPLGVERPQAADYLLHLPAKLVRSPGDQ